MLGGMTIERHQEQPRKSRPRALPLPTWVPTQIRTWSRRQWTAAGCSYVAALLMMGILGETLPGASQGRAVPVEWWNYVTLALSPPLIALIVATFIPDKQAGRER